MAELRLYDRSRVTTDWTCPRKRYWQYEYDRKGIVSGNTHLELWMGTTVHDGLAAIAVQHLTGEVNIDEIATAARKQMYDSLMGDSETFLQDEYNFACEQGALVEGLLRGFYRAVWPRLMSQYPIIVTIEQEMEYTHDGLTFMSKPDLVLEDSEGEWHYIEYKSTSSKKEDWVNSWTTAVQLHSSMSAITQTLGKTPIDTTVLGLYKGYVSYGKQGSIFCYAYKKNGNPPFTQDDVTFEYKAGYKRSPVWEMPGGVKGWVESLPENILSSQFLQTAPIMINEDMITQFFEQRKWREHELVLANQMISHAAGDPIIIQNILNTAYPQRFDQCVPAWGKPCQYRQLCFGNVPNPLEAGWEYRQPHHTQEEELFAKNRLPEGILQEEVCSGPSVSREDQSEGPQLLENTPTET